jgi:hypothetical protein
MLDTQKRIADQSLRYEQANRITDEVFTVKLEDKFGISFQTDGRVTRATCSLNPLPGRKCGLNFPWMGTVCPVFGLRARRGFR